MAGAHTGASFTAEVVAELAPHVPPLPCCRAALVEGMGLAAGGDATAAVRLTRPVAARLALAVLHADGHAARVERRRTARRPRWAVLSEEDATAVRESSDRACCRRARLRGAFIAGGSVSRPDGAPHLELRCVSADAAARLQADLEAVGVAATSAVRRGHPVVATRSVDGVAAVLSVIGAQGGRLRFEEGRVVREMRGGVNRRLNSETANLRRVVSAGVAQARAAQALALDGPRWAALPPALREAAELRRRHPQESLEGLAARAACSRSAMAGRLRRLLEAVAGDDDDGGAARGGRRRPRGRP